MCWTTRSPEGWSILNAWRQPTLQIQTDFSVIILFQPELKEFHFIILTQSLPSRCRQGIAC